MHAADGVHRVSSRPSDALALAIRVGTPIYAAEAVLDEAAFEAEDDAEERSPRRRPRWSRSSGSSSTT